MFSLFVIKEMHRYGDKLKKNIRKAMVYSLTSSVRGGGLFTLNCYNRLTY